jgi:hypothetical protein
VAGSMTPHDDDKTSSRWRPPTHQQCSSGDKNREVWCELG